MTRRGRAAVSVLAAVTCATLGATLGAPATDAADQPVVRVRVADPDVPEGKAAWVAVVLDAPVAHPVTVQVDTRAGLARAPGDYVGLHRRVSVPAGQTRVRLAVPTSADGIDEGPEEFDVRLSDPSGATLGRRSTTVTIRDGDPRPRVTVRAATFTEPLLGHRLGYTRVRLSARSGRRVVVDLVTRSGTALAGQDFVRRFPTVVFEPGRTRAPVYVELLSDGVKEPAERMRIAVVAVRRAEDAGGATMTILDASATTG